jgi:hypothetical protein
VGFTLIVSWIFPGKGCLFPRTRGGPLLACYQLADCQLFPHTHKPYQRVLPNNQYVINDGGVGKLKDNNPHAAYVILEAVRRDLHIEFVRAPSAVEQAATVIEAPEMPHEYAQMLHAAAD